MNIKANYKILLCLLYIVFSVSGLIVIKLGSNIHQTKSIIIPFLNFNLSPVSLVGIACYGIGFCIYLGVISNYSVGYIVPLLGGIVNIILLVASTLILKEGLSVKSIIGALIVVIGIVVMNI